MAHRIFLSSTYTDLVDERKAVEQAIIALGQQFVGMEYFFSREETSLDTCLAQVAESQFFILIVGHRYGYTDSNNISYTEREYIKAGELGTPRFVFLAADHDGSENSKRVSEQDPEPEKQDEIKRFRNDLLKRHAVSFFRNPDELARQVVLTLVREIKNWHQDYSEQFNNSSNALTSISQIRIGEPGFLSHLRDQIDSVKSLVGQSKYRKAVALAKDIRQLTGEGKNLSTWEFQLAYGELNVWYCHALIYTGEPKQAITVLRFDVINQIEKVEAVFKQNSATYTRWNLILGRAYNLIGWAKWISLRSYEDSLKEFWKSIPFFQAGNLREELATVMDNIGRVYAEIGFRDRSELLIDHGRHIRQGMQDSYRVALSLNSIARVQLAYGYPDGAIVLAEDAREIFAHYVDEKGKRGIGIALLTKAKALHHLGKASYAREAGIRTKLNKLLDAQTTLNEAKIIFEDRDIGEKVRSYQIYSELGCISNERAFLLMNSNDKDGAYRAIDTAQELLERSIHLAKGDGQNIEYPAYYVDACINFAEASMIINDWDQASLWIEKASATIPNEYKFLRDTKITSPIEFCEDFWLQLSKINLLQSRITRMGAPMTLSGKSERDRFYRFMKSYSSTIGYINCYFNRPLSIENKPLYPSTRPLLPIKHDLVEELYTVLKHFPNKQLTQIKQRIIPQLKKDLDIVTSPLSEYLDDTLELLIKIEGDDSNK